MRKQFLALLSGALVLALSVGRRHLRRGRTAGVGDGISGEAGVAPAGRDNLETPLSKEQARAPRQRRSSCSLKGEELEGKVAKLGKGQRRAGARRHRPDLRGHRRVRRRAYPHPLLPGENPDGTPASNAHRLDGPLHNRSPSPTASTTTRRCGRPTTTRPITITCTSIAWRSTTRRNPRAATRSKAMSPSGSRCRSTRRATAAISAAASSATTPRP